MRALERKLARCCEADGEVPLPARATRADSTRAAEVAALYGLRAEEYADGAVRCCASRERSRPAFGAIVFSPVSE